VSASPDVTGLISMFTLVVYPRHSGAVESPGGR